MVKQEKDTLYVTTAAYGDVDDAVADYAAVPPISLRLSLRRT